MKEYINIYALVKCASFISTLPFAFVRIAAITDASTVWDVVVFASAISDVRLAHSELEISRRYSLSVASAKYGWANLKSLAVSWGLAAMKG